jgi:ubiquinone/menaquinone biosynthesis C-methylase UbiE
MGALDFGYPWWLSYGHLVILAVALAVLWPAYRRRWPKWIRLPFAVVAVWAAVAFLAVQFGLNVNGRGSLPTQSFLASGAGRVVDLGAGTGRSAIMVLEERPLATLVALDLFGESFVVHFGDEVAPEEKLAANLRAAGVEQRATVVKGDMRELPFEDSSFDAAVSSYAIDHLSRDGSKQALGEAARVIRPGGEFLLMVVTNDFWAKLMFGPLLAHGGRQQSWWKASVQEAGFEILEQGTVPATLYILARRSQ